MFKPRCAGGAASANSYDALPPQLWDYAATNPGHYMRQAGGLLAPGNGSSGNGSAAAEVADPAGSGADGGGAGAAAEPDLYLCYALEGGLLNQHYTHFSALATAIAIGAKGVVRIRPSSILSGDSHDPALAA